MIMCLVCRRRVCLRVSSCLRIPQKNVAKSLRDTIESRTTKKIKRIQESVGNHRSGRSEWGPVVISLFLFSDIFVLATESD